MQIAENETGTTSTIQLSTTRDVVNMQVSFVSSGECVIQASLDGGNTWEDIEGATFTSGTVTTFSPLPAEIRVKVYSGEVNVWVK